LCLTLPFLSFVDRGAQESPQARIAVDVNLVVLNATVRDRSGGFASGLRKEDFQVFEDGHLQTISLFRHEDVPVAVGLVVDNSSSMRSKRQDVIQAAMAFMHSSNPKDEMFVVNFNERASLGLPSEQPFSSNPVELEAALNGVPARGMTALYDAIDLGLKHLKDSACDKKVLIVVSDGGDNASHHRLDRVLDDAARSDAMIYTIGLFDEDDVDRNPGVLRRISRATGGETFLPTDPAEITPICRRIAADIRAQYTIGYSPTNAKLDNTYRTVRVTAMRPHGSRLLVRTRTGYIAASPHAAGVATQGDK
jgi:Ca-activated chloride channel homolog